MTKRTRKQRKLKGVRNTKTPKGFGKKVDTTDPITRLPDNFLELVPPHNLPEVDGKVRLYHFTQPNFLEGILKYGIAVGDVVSADPFAGWNAPNLTANRFFHNPGNRQAEIMMYDYLRLEIVLDANDEKIVPYDWFDQNFGKSNTQYCIEKGLEKGVDNGTLNEQYLYRGAVPPSAIKKVSKWNGKTQYWDRLSKTEIEEQCRQQIPEYLSLVSIICNYIDNDWTDGVAEKALKFQHLNSRYRGLYELAKVTIRHLTRNEKRKFRQFLLILITSKSSFTNIYGVISHFARKHKGALQRAGVRFLWSSQAAECLSSGEPVAMKEQIRIQHPF